MNTVRIRIFR